MLKFFKNEHTNITEADRELDSKSFGEIQVIGAGLPRTGSLSLKTALTQLYGGKCYHMMDVIAGKQEDVDIWCRGIRGELTSAEWREYFSTRNYAAGVDFPFASCYKDILKAYPDAKVVLSVRDPKTWHGSVFNSIWKMRELFKWHPTSMWMVNCLDRTPGCLPCPHDLEEVLDTKVMDGCQDSFRGAIEGGPEVAERFFNDWVAEVKRSVPADRLLVHSAKQGWEPLCAFLGLPVPDTTYPRVNDTASIQAMVGRIWWINCIIFYCLPTALAVGAGYLHREDLAPAAWSLVEGATAALAGVRAQLGL